MSLNKNEELLNYEMIYRPDDNKQKLLNEIEKEDNSFEMIYKPNENKQEKKKKIKFFEEYKLFHLLDDKEYSGDVIRILDKYFIIL